MCYSKYYRIVYSHRSLLSKIYIASVSKADYGLTMWDGSGIFGLHFSLYMNVSGVAIHNSTANGYYRAGASLGLRECYQIRVKDVLITHQRLNADSAKGIFTIENSHFNDVQNITLQDISLQANNSAASGIYISYSSENNLSLILVERVEVDATGIASGPLNLHFAEQNKIHNITLNDISLSGNSTIGGGLGCSITWDNVLRNISVTNISSSSLFEHGLISLTDYYHNTSISNLFVNNSNLSLIYLNDSTNNSFIDVYLGNSEKNAIWGIGNNIIFHNISINSTSLAIDLTDSRNITLENVYFANTPWDVYLRNSTVSRYDMGDFSLEIANVTGSIKFTNLSLNASGSNLSQVIRLSNNSAFIIPQPTQASTRQQTLHSLISAGPLQESW
jgi:hypothetical protein